MSDRREYVLRRGRGWICAPAGHDRSAVFCRGLTVSEDGRKVWRCDDLNLAHDRAAILQHVYGWKTQIFALHPDDE